MALVPLVVVFSFFLGPTYALLQRLVSDEMRATMLSVVMLLLVTVATAMAFAGLRKVARP